MFVTMCLVVQQDFNCNVLNIVCVIVYILNYQGKEMVLDLETSLVLGNLKVNQYLISFEESNSEPNEHCIR